MRCRQVRGLMPDHFNKELSEADRRALEAHMAECPTCHKHWRNLYRAEIWLVRASQQGQSKRGPSVDFTTSVMASIVARQQQATQPSTPPMQHLHYEQEASPLLLPLGSWFGWETNTLGTGNFSSRMLLSGVFLVLVPVMAAVIFVGVLLTQPALASQVFGAITNGLANVVSGIYSLVTHIATLANNQFLLAGVAAGYVALALLWYGLMRQPGRERQPGFFEEVES